MMIEDIMVAYNAPDPNPYLFAIEQWVRLKKGQSDDGQTPEYWDGAKVKVISRYCTGIHKEHWYKLFHPEQNVTCDFCEDEIDGRYAKKT